LFSDKGSLKNNFTFYAPMHPAWLRCESSEYPDIPAFSLPLHERDDTSILKNNGVPLARQAPQHLKL
jgi:hypothetical protein